MGVGGVKTSVIGPLGLDIALDIKGSCTTSSVVFQRFCEGIFWDAPPHSAKRGYSD